MTQAWKTAPIDSIDRVLFFDLPVETDGSIKAKRGWPEKWKEMLQEFQRGGPAVDLVISILTSDRFQAVFSSDEAVRRLLDESIALLDDGHAQGLHMDIEVYSAVQPEVLARYRAFVVELQRRFRLKYPRRVLSVFVPMGGETPLYEGQQLRGFDWVVVQAYDAHWVDGPTAGPLSPLDGDFNLTWSKASQQVVAWGLNPRRVLMSYPLYGYEWPVKSLKPLAQTQGAAATTTLEWVDPLYLPAKRINVSERTGRHAPQEDEVSGSSYYMFRREGQAFVGWYEGSRSLELKQEFLRRRMLGGLAFFVLGYDNHSVLRQHAMTKQQASPRIRAAKRLSLGLR